MNFKYINVNVYIFNILDIYICIIHYIYIIYY